VRHAGGTVDAARGALRDTFNKGIEKGKATIGKAQAAVGLATEKMESKAQAATLSHSSAVEKALHERYEKPSSLDKSVEETLAERYKPIEERDNTVLRGM
jgi:MICOS complex subunit MIC12